MRDLKIVFMGTPEFAVPSLEILVENGLDVVAVITAPDKQSGRGRKINISPVKEFALKYGLKILQPTNLKSPDFQKELKDTGVNLQIVVAFRMLPEAVWSMPEFGTFNLHASLLPQYRGAAPINWAIINGEKKTGITTFFLKHEIDTGNVILQQEEEILNEDNVGSLYQRLMTKGAELVLKTVRLIEEEKENPRPQILESESKEAPKIFKEDCKINWNKTREEVRNFIRGLSPYPGAWTLHNGEIYKIFQAEFIRDYSGPERPIGGIEKFEKNRLIGFTSDGPVEIIELQAPGKRKMKSNEFLAGNTI